MRCEQRYCYIEKEVSAGAYPDSGRIGLFATEASTRRLSAQCPTLTFLNLALCSNIALQNVLWMHRTRVSLICSLLMNCYWLDPNRLYWLDVLVFFLVGKRGGFFGEWCWFCGGTVVVWTLWTLDKLIVNWWVSWWLGLMMKNCKETKDNTVTKLDHNSTLSFIWKCVSSIKFGFLWFTLVLDPIWFYE